MKLLCCNLLFVLLSATFINIVLSQGGGGGSWKEPRQHGGSSSSRSVESTDSRHSSGGGPAPDPSDQAERRLRGGTSQPPPGSRKSTSARSSIPARPFATPTPSPIPWHPKPKHPTPRRGTPTSSPHGKWSSTMPNRHNDVQFNINNPGPAALEVEVVGITSEQTFGISVSALILAVVCLIAVFVLIYLHLQSAQRAHETNQAQPAAVPAYSDTSYAKVP